MAKKRKPIDKPPQRDSRFGLRVATLVFSLLAAVAIAALYLQQPDSCAALTMLPIWSWCIPGWLLVAAAVDGPTRRLGTAAALAWLGILLGLAEEPRSLALGAAGLPSWPNKEWLKERDSGRALRAVTLNCAGGSLEAATEVVALQPDLVFLQESPSRGGVESLARTLYGAKGDFVWGRDCSLVVRGNLKVDGDPLRNNTFTRATATPINGQDLELVSLRLNPPVFRFDFFNPQCWRAHTDNRRIHRRELAEVADVIRAPAAARPVIAAGDYNAVQGDSSTTPLQPLLRDAFGEAGVGWGNTALNHIPLARIDKVWLSRELRPAAIVAIQTQNSDHRMVVCDLLLPATGSD